MIKNLVAMSILLLWVVGCANIPFSVDQCNATLYETAMEANQCLNAAASYEQEQYDREDKLTLKRDKLVVFLNNCDAAVDLVIVEYIKFGRSKLPSKRDQSKAKQEYGYKYTHDNLHRNARRSDFVCMNPSDVLRQLGLGR